MHACVCLCHVVWWRVMWCGGVSFGVVHLWSVVLCCVVLCSAVSEQACMRICMRVCIFLIDLGFTSMSPTSLCITTMRCINVAKCFKLQKVLHKFSVLLSSIQYPEQGSLPPPTHYRPASKSDDNDRRLNSRVPKASCVKDIIAHVSIDWMLDALKLKVYFVRKTKQNKIEKAW